MADLYQAEQVQLVLFEAFFADGEKDQSRTLDVYDALPKFSLRGKGTTIQSPRVQQRADPGQTHQGVGVCRKLHRPRGGRRNDSDQSDNHRAGNMSAFEIATVNLDHDIYGHVVIFGALWSMLIAPLSSIGPSTRYIALDGCPRHQGFYPSERRAVIICVPT